MFIFVTRGERTTRPPPPSYIPHLNYA